MDPCVRRDPCLSQSVLRVAEGFKRLQSDRPSATLILSATSDIGSVLTHPVFLMLQSSGQGKRTATPGKCREDWMGHVLREFVRGRGSDDGFEKIREEKHRKRRREVNDLNKRTYDDSSKNEGIYCRSFNLIKSISVRGRPHLLLGANPRSHTTTSSAS
jgi:hypothetical protein